MPGPAVGVSTAVLRLARELRVALDGAFATMELTSQQAGLLVHVLAGESSPTTLAALLGADTAGMSRLLDRLERKGLIDRVDDPRDRRAIQVTLTPSGSALAPALPAVFEQVATRLVGDAHLPELTRTIEAMRANLVDEGGRDEREHAHRGDKVPAPARPSGRGADERAG